MKAPVEEPQEEGGEELELEVEEKDGKVPHTMSTEMVLFGISKREQRSTGRREGANWTIVCRDI